MHDLYNLLNELFENKMSDVVLLHGTEQYLKETAIEAIAVHYIGEGMRELDFVHFNASDMDMVKVIESTSTLTMFSPARVTLVTDIDAKQHGSDLLRGEAEEALIDLIKAVPEPNILILTSKGKSKTKIVNAVKKNGKLFDMRRLTHDELRSFIIKQLAERDCDCDTDIAEEIAVLSGYLNNEASSDLYELANDLSKIAAYSQGRRVTRSDVTDLLADDANSYVFSLANAVKSRNGEEAYRILKNMLAKKRSTFSILPVFIFQFEDMLVYKEMSKAGFLKADMQKNMGNQPFRLSKAQSLSKNYSYEELAALLKIMYSLGDDIKSGLLSDALAIELLISRMLESAPHTR